MNDNKGEAMTWFIYQQNNSGGYIYDNEAVSDYVWIEANNRDDADEKFWIIVEDHSEFCECCGARWSAFGSTAQESMPSAYLYGPSVAYHLDGKIESIGNLAEKELIMEIVGVNKEVLERLEQQLKDWLLSHGVQQCKSLSGTSRLLTTSETMKAG